MSADVLMTGAGGDLDMRDVMRDTSSPTFGPPLIAQQLEIILLIPESGWVWNGTLGIDWLGYLTSRNVNTSALAGDMTRTAEEIPGVRIERATATQTGRVVTVQLEARYQGAPLAGVLAVDASATPRVGDDYFMALPSFHWNYRPIK